MNNSFYYTIGLYYYPDTYINIILSLASNVHSWHKTDHQSPHASISAPAAPEPSCVAVGVNPQSGSHNHRHNANAWLTSTSETHSFI